LLGALSVPAGATVVGGGGSPTTDCLLVLDADVNSPSSKPKNVVCTDGDPACDRDGTVNGVCEFNVSVCANSTFDPRCTLNGVTSIVVDHALDNGDSKFDTDFQALQQRVTGSIDPSTGSPNTDPNVCTSATSFHLAVDGPFLGPSCKRTRKSLRITTLSVPSMTGKVSKDSDKMTFTCNPAPPPGGCDPTAFFTGTYDRIQRQVFDQSCALSGCHDSQTLQNQMNLETGASYGNLINVTPFNTTAQGSPWNWKRVTPGDPLTSYLYRKVSGDLPDKDLGVRMPFHRGALDDHLVDIIRLWIEDGAKPACTPPAPDCWTPGTDN
jgi:hypothetical protein